MPKTTTQFMLEKFNTQAVAARTSPIGPDEFLEEKEKVVNEKQVSTAPRLVFSGPALDEEDAENQQGQRHTALVSLQQIKQEFDNFVAQLAAEKNIPVADMEKLGYKAEMQGNNLLVIQMPNANESAQFLQLLGDKGMINLPKPEDKADQEAAAAPETPSKLTPLKMTPSLFNY